ncbi:hypothetical protein O5290_31170, partial [Escherichia coli]|nr:hypothetical protein [Escherichia coli]
ELRLRSCPRGNAGADPLARRYLELHDEIADLDVMIAAIVDELAPALIKRNAIGYESASGRLK